MRSHNVKIAAKSNPRGRNVGLGLGLNKIQEGNNFTVSISKQKQLLDKVRREKEFKKIQKLRDFKRTKRRKELEKMLQKGYKVIFTFLILVIN